MQQVGAIYRGEITNWLNEYALQELFTRLVRRSLRNLAALLLRKRYRDRVARGLRIGGNTVIINFCLRQVGS